MTPDQVLTSILSALGPVAVFGTFTTGLLLGAFLVYPTRGRVARVFDIVWGFALIGVVFFASRGITLYAEGQSAVAA